MLKRELLLFPDCPDRPDAEAALTTLAAPPPPKPPPPCCAKFDAVALGAGRGGRRAQATDVEAPADVHVEAPGPVAAQRVARRRRRADR